MRTVTGQKWQGQAQGQKWWWNAEKVVLIKARFKKPLHLWICLTHFNVFIPSRRNATPNNYVKVWLCSSMSTHIRIDFGPGNNKPDVLSDNTQSTLGKDTVACHIKWFEAWLKLKNGTDSWALSISKSAGLLVETDIGSHHRHIHSVSDLFASTRRVRSGK